MKRHIGRSYRWVREDGHTVELGTLKKIEPLENSTILTFDDGRQIIDDRRVEEIKRGLFGGQK